MNVKAFDMLVLERPGSEIRRLHDSHHPATRLEIQAITGTHAHLWRLEVFLDAEIVDLKSQFAQELAGAIQQEVGPKNEIEGFSNVPSIDLEELENKVLLNHTLGVLKVGDVVKKKDYEELISANFKTSEPAQYFNQVRAMLIQRGYAIQDAQEDTST